MRECLNLYLRFKQKTVLQVSLLSIIFFVCIIHYAYCSHNRTKRDGEELTYNPYSKPDNSNSVETAAINLIEKFIDGYKQDSSQNSSSLFEKILGV